MKKTELLKKYKELYDSGVLTEEEFVAMKKGILAIPETEESLNDEIVEDTPEPEEPEVEESPVEEISPQQAEENRKNEIYEKAKEYLLNGDLKSYRRATDLLESISGWKDADVLAETARKEIELLLKKEAAERAEQEELRALKKAKMKKIIKFVLIGVAALAVLFVISSIISLATMTDISDCGKMKKDAIHSLEYKVPAIWNEGESDNPEESKVYVYENDGEIVALLEVAYDGETDLDGDAAALSERDYLPKAVEEMSYYEVTRDSIEAKYSKFTVTLYYNSNEVKGYDELFSKIMSGIDKNNYKNPRKGEGKKVEYSGSTKAGVELDNSNEDITVTEKFDTGVATGSKTFDWTIDNPKTLKAGQTSTVTIKTHDGDKVKLKVECTDLSESQYKAKCVNRGYKDQLRNESEGEYIKIYGCVLQDCGSGYYRISSSGEYNDVYMVYAPYSDLVEDDWATCYGTTSGIYEYETVMGANQKVPSMIAKYTER